MKRRKKSIAVLPKVHCSFTKWWPFPSQSASEKAPINMAPRATKTPKKQNIYMQNSVSQRKMAQ